MSSSRSEEQSIMHSQRTKRAKNMIYQHPAEQREQREREEELYRLLTSAGSSLPLCSDGGAFPSLALKILSFLSLPDIFRLRSVCRSWNLLLKSPLLLDILSSSWIWLLSVRHSGHIPIQDIPEALRPSPTVPYKEVVLKEYVLFCGVSGRSFPLSSVLSSTGNNRLSSLMGGSNLFNVVSYCGMNELHGVDYLVNHVASCNGLLCILLLRHPPIGSRRGYRILVLNPLSGAHKIIPQPTHAPKTFRDPTHFTLRMESTSSRDPSYYVLLESETNGRVLLYHSATDCWSSPALGLRDPPATVTSSLQDLQSSMFITFRTRNRDDWIDRYSFPGCRIREYDFLAYNPHASRWFRLDPRYSPVSRPFLDVSAGSYFFLFSHCGRIFATAPLLFPELGRPPIHYPDDPVNFELFVEFLRTMPEESDYLLYLQHKTIILQGFGVWELVQCSSDGPCSWKELARTPTRLWQEAPSSHRIWFTFASAGSLVYATVVSHNVLQPPLVYDLDQDYWYFLSTDNQMLGCAAACALEPSLCSPV